MNEAEQIMKRCQAGTRNYNEANNLHAACYGMIGKLLAQTKQERELWQKQLTSAQRNELKQIENGTWEADRNG
jgi:hypothetical protein